MSHSITFSRTVQYGLVAASLILPLPLQATTESRLKGGEQELATAWKSYDDATVRNDIKTLSALVTDDYMLVNSDASVQDKASYLADFAVPGFRIEPYVVEHPFSRVFGEAGWTGGTLRLRWTQDEQAQTRRLRTIHFWVRQKGRWRLAYTQLTRVPD